MLLIGASCQWTSAWPKHRLCTRAKYWTLTHSSQTAKLKKSWNLPLANPSALRLYPWQRSVERFRATIFVTAAAAGVLNELFIIFVTARTNSCWLCLAVEIVVVAAASATSSCHYLLFLLPLLYYNIYYYLLLYSSFCPLLLAWPRRFLVEFFCHILPAVRFGHISWLHTRLRWFAFATVSWSLLAFIKIVLVGFIYIAHVYVYIYYILIFFQYFVYFPFCKFLLWRGRHAVFAKGVRFFIYLNFNFIILLLRHIRAHTCTPFHLMTAFHLRTVQQTPHSYCRLPLVLMHSHILPYLHPASQQFFISPLRYCDVLGLFAFEAWRM